MIVFLNMERRAIELYTPTGMERFAFEEAPDLSDYIKGKNVLYVTGAVEATAADIVSLVADLEPGVAEDMNDGQYFLRSNVKGSLHLQDVDLTFNGPGDCKPVDEDLALLVRDSFQIKEMLRSGKIEMVNSRQMRKAVRDAQKEIRRKDRLRKLKEQKELDSIIVSDGLRAEDAAANMFDSADDDDVETIALDANEGDKELTEDEILKGGLS